ncbi:MAG: Rrf2 family transcriptional regulator [Candidatus Cloacimonadaceae bacterium]|nr:Rrf2 family transcriptional regulator [Candidatus Cloacimonadaceae bacterium]
MAVNTRTEYALRALIEIMESGDNAISAAEICRRQSLPKKYIEHLLAGLKCAGFISSTAGSKGGYLLAKQPDEIGLYAIMNAVEDTSLELNCNVQEKRFCLGHDCGLHPLWTKLTCEIKEILERYTLQTIYDEKYERKT